MVSQDGNFFITAYTGELTIENVIKAVSKIRFSFPDLPAEFYDVFQERIKANSFTDERLIDAVDSIIDNCIYPKPTIAQFISFDRRIQVFTHEQMCKKVREYGPEIWDSFKSVKFDAMIKPVWIHVNNIEKYKIETI